MRSSHRAEPLPGPGLGTGAWAGAGWEAGRLAQTSAWQRCPLHLPAMTEALCGQLWPREAGQHPRVVGGVVGTAAV